MVKRTLPGLDFRTLDVLEVASDVLYIRLSGLVVPDLAPQIPGLLKVNY